MPVDELNHYNLCVPAAEQARVIDFYERVLGFEFRQNGRLLWLWRGPRPLVHLTVLPEGASSPGAAGVIDHIAFSCTGLAAMGARIAQQSVACRVRPYPEMGFTQVVLHDPIGLKIELNFAGEYPVSD
jgi:catechol 2,3-dioxygenase-like lactoylglutathione lyase family enzyme